MSVEGEWRQMTFEELLSGNRGEASSDRQSDEEPPATHESGCSGTAGLLDAMLERQNLLLALRRVKKNRGSPGVDGMTVSELGPWLVEHWLEVKAAIVARTYRPSPVRRKEISKPGDEAVKLQPQYASKVERLLEKFRDLL